MPCNSKLSLTQPKRFVSHSVNNTSLCVTPDFFLVPTHGSTELRSFRNASAIAALQDEAQLTLNSYIHTR